MASLTATANRPTSRQAYLVAASLLVFVALASVASGQTPGAAPENELAETGRKLSNPISDVWALFTEFDANFADGDVNSGDAQVGSRLIFQPILPVPLYGKGAKRWNLITRPTIPVLFTQAVPTAFNSFDHSGGLGDIQVPTVISPPMGQWLLGAGPAFLLPTASDDAFGRQQWGIGPAAVVGYRTKSAIFGAFGQYYFGIGSSGTRAPGVQDASYMHLLYFLFVNLPHAWQFGFDPTITYDARATSGNKWNVPVGMMITKTTRFNKLPVKFQFGVEYSVVSQDLYGQQARLILDVIPVIPPLVHHSVLGGS